MGRARRALINLFLLTLLAGSLFDIAVDREHWPFSQYPMFSGVWSASTFSWLRLFGVDAEGREISLAGNEYVAPFDQSRLPKAFKRMMESGDLDRVRAGIADCLRRYEELRRDRRHEGPPIVAMRLYELEWTIDPRAANVDRPDRSRLIAEVTR